MLEEFENVNQSDFLRKNYPGVIRLMNQNYVVRAIHSVFVDFHHIKGILATGNSPKTMYMDLTQPPWSCGLAMKLKTRVELLEALKN